MPVKRYYCFVSSVVFVKVINWQSPPAHGGDLLRAQKQFSELKTEPTTELKTGAKTVLKTEQSTDQWLDLSAALNPNPWPIPDIPAVCFNQLPENYDELIAVAADYYQQSSLWPVSGSQQIIELLPQLRKRSKVAVPEAGYQEHAWCWHKAGHQVMTYTPNELEHAAKCCDVVITINPNNPTGQKYNKETLLQLQRQLAQRDGWLIVDEAFMDALPESEQASLSIANKAELPGLFVLRSVGKFFGLAGIRSGFILCQPNMLQQIRTKLGPWHLNGVSSYLTQQLLQDMAWQITARKQLSMQMSHQAEVLTQLLTQPDRYDANLQGKYIGHTPLFYSLYHPDAHEIQQQLAQHGIWVRYFPESSWLRFGLAADDTALNRLQRALNIYLRK